MGQGIWPILFTWVQEQSHIETDPEKRVRLIEKNYNLLPAAESFRKVDCDCTQLVIISRVTVNTSHFFKK